MEEIKKRGGARPGAGRKAGGKNSGSSGTRPQRPQIRAYEDEWLLIRAFEKIVKKGDRAAAEKFVEKYQVE